MAVDISGSFFKSLEDKTVETAKKDGSNRNKKSIKSLRGQKKTLVVLLHQGSLKQLPHQKSMS